NMKPLLKPTIVSSKAVDSIGVRMLEPNLTLTKSVDKVYAVVGDIVTYTIVAANTGDIILGNVALKPITIFDMLSPGLEFIEGSIRVDGISKPLSGILKGVSIGELVVGGNRILKFKAKIVSAAISPIKNTSRATFGFKLPCYDSEVGVAVSNIVSICVDRAVIEVIKSSDKNFVVLGDIITYTIKLKNTGSLEAINVRFKDIIPNTIELLNGSFSLNGDTINSVNLKQGINVGSIKVGESSIIKYSVKVINSNCTFKIINEAEVKFDYRLANNNVGTSKSEKACESMNVVTIGMNNFKQITIEDNVIIPTSNHDIEEVSDITAEINILKSHIIKTPISQSNEGQKLTGYKLVVHGIITELIQYTALEDSQSIHSECYRIPFTTFIILSENYCNTNVKVESIVEEIYSKKINNRTIFTNATILIKVCGRSM
ncbi:MAG: hypothetical protein ACRDA5_10475, partial [Clostridium sp.]